MKYPRVTFIIHDTAYAEQEVTGRQYGDWAVIDARPGTTKDVAIFHVPTGQGIRRYCDWDKSSSARWDRADQMYAIAAALADTPPRDTAATTLIDYLPADFQEYVNACFRVKKQTRSRWSQYCDIPSYPSWAYDKEERRKAAECVLCEPGTPLRWSESNHFRLTPDGRTLCGKGGRYWLWDVGGKERDPRPGEKCPDCERMLEQCAVKDRHSPCETAERSKAWLRAHPKQRAEVVFCKLNPEQSPEQQADLRLLLLGV